MITGSTDKCNLTPTRKDYDYIKVSQELIDKYGLEKLGEGGFGVILGGKNCVVKIIKNISRCPELQREKSIYNVIDQYRPLPGLGQVPHFYLYSELDTFCHFNIERIYSALSGWGDIIDDNNGYGYVLGIKNDMYIFHDLNSNDIYNIDKDKVYGIERPGNLIHFYINYFDPNLKEKLDQNQGILMGLNKLVSNFGQDLINECIYEIGILL